MSLQGSLVNFGCGVTQDGRFLLIWKLHLKKSGRFMCDFKGSREEGTQFDTSSVSNTRNQPPIWCFSLGAGCSAAISEELLMEVYPGLVEYYANQVNINALPWWLLVVVLEKKSLLFGVEEEIGRVVCLCACFGGRKKGLKYFQWENLSLSTYYPKKFLTRRPWTVSSGDVPLEKTQQLIIHWLTWSHLE